MSVGTTKISTSQSNAVIPTTIRPVFRRIATATSRIQAFFDVTRWAASCSSVHYSSDRDFRPFLLDENWSSGEGIHPNRPCASDGPFDERHVWVMDIHLER